MTSLTEGVVVICSTGQAGTIVESLRGEAWVLLRNGDVWVGPHHGLRFPQDQADLDACPIDVERVEIKRTISDRD